MLYHGCLYFFPYPAVLHFVSAYSVPFALPFLFAQRANAAGKARGTARQNSLRRHTWLPKFIARSPSCNCTFAMMQLHIHERAMNAPACVESCQRRNEACRHKKLNCSALFIAKSFCISLFNYIFAWLNYTLYNN